MMIARLTSVLLALAVSAGVASASSVVYDEDVSGDLGGAFDTPDEDLGTLLPGGHFLVKGTVGALQGDNSDPFGFTTVTPFTVSLIDFELVPDNGTLSMLLEQNTTQVSFDAVDSDGAVVPVFGGAQFAAGSYVLGPIENNPAISQPYQLRISTAPSEVPLPAAAWLLVGGVAALGAAKAARRRRD